MEMDCCFINENNRFRYRVGAIIIENDCVLFASNDNSDYYYSVGGGVHMGETAEEAVVREVYEETGVKYEIDRLVFINENFFDGNGSTEGMKCHEISFYFIMKPRGSQQLNSNSYCADGKESMYWIPISDLSKYKIYPEFLRYKLNPIPKNIEHILTH